MLLPANPKGAVERLFGFFVGVVDVPVDVLLDPPLLFPLEVDVLPPLDTPPKLPVRIPAAPASNIPSPSESSNSSAKLATESAFPSPSLSNTPVVVVPS